MRIIVQEGNVSIREMEPTKQDFSIFLKWMTDPETMKFWDGMSIHFTYETVIKKYQEHQEEQVEQ